MDAHKQKKRSNLHQIESIEGHKNKEISLTFSELLKKMLKIKKIMKKIFIHLGYFRFTEKQSKNIFQSFTHPHVYTQSQTK